MSVTATKLDYETKTDIHEFVLFHELLTKKAPHLFEPFYFPVEKNGKEPVPGISWKRNGKTFQQALKLMQAGYNIGIAGTDEDILCIMDVDDMGQVPAEQIKPTLEVTSRKRIGRHYYYFSPDGSAKRNIPTGSAGELRSRGQYVLAPGSYVPCAYHEVERMPEVERKNAGLYTVTCSREAVEITFDELPNVYKSRHIEMLKLQAEAEKKARERKNRIVPKVIKYKSALWDLSITDVSGLPNTGYKKVPMPSEIHGSETGHNCSVNNGLLHCWRHNVTHCAFSYLGVLAGIGNCEQLGKPHGSGSFGIDFQNRSTIYKIWEYAKQHGYIPEDDPIPHAGLVYYAIEKKRCSESDLVDGRLSDYIYMTTPLIAKYSEGINFGRL